MYYRIEVEHEINEATADHLEGFDLGFAKYGNVTVSDGVTYVRVDVDDKIQQLLGESGLEEFKNSMKRGVLAGAEDWDVDIAEGGVTVVQMD